MDDRERGAQRRDAAVEVRDTAGKAQAVKCQSLSNAWHISGIPCTCVWPFICIFTLALPISGFYHLACFSLKSTKKEKEYVYAHC